MVTYIVKVIRNKCKYHGCTHAFSENDK